LNKGDLAIYQNEDGSVVLDVRLENDTIWLNQAQMAKLFESSIKNVNDHIQNILREEELSEKATIRNFRIVQAEGTRKVTRNVLHYNLDMIISIGYRIKSKTATKFRIWATGVLKKFLTDGFILNEKLFIENQKRLDALKMAVSILNRNIQNNSVEPSQIKGISNILSDFSMSLNLLTAFDRNDLDNLGKTTDRAEPITYEELAPIIEQMRVDVNSNIFGIQKDSGFQSAVKQIYQSFEGIECYPTIEEKAAMLLYFIVKNHSFVDGNKRIAVACFLYFLNKNGLLYKTDDQKAINNDALFSLALFISNSKPDEMNTIKQIIVSILNYAADYDSRLSNFFL
jgi:death-on-curing family protein